MPSPSAEPEGRPGFVELVCEIVDSIPPAHVMTYGDVAATLGSRGARAVGRVMSQYGRDLPWWRVVRAGGHPPRCHEDRALEFYRAEGTPLLRSPDGAYRIDYRAARWMA